MSYKVFGVQKLATDITRMVVHAPEVARHARAGQFLVIMSDEKAERIPLTIVGSDFSSGAVTVIFQEIGSSTRRLGMKEAGASLFAVLGPLGRPTDARKIGTVVCVAGGVGLAEILPVMRVFKGAGNRVIGLLGCRTKDLLILEEEIRQACEEVRVATNDGSLGTRGLVTSLLEEFLKEEACGLVYAVGPVPMMRAVCEVTRPLKIRTTVSLNPVMVDATGMCGVCRCRVAGKTVFGCVDGPEFDGHQVDFDELSQRLSFFRKEEELSAKALERTP